MVIKNRSRVCIIISVCIILVAAILTVCGHGINLGIDFASGMSIQFDLNEKADKAKVESILNGMAIDTYTVLVQGSGDEEVNIRIANVSENESTKLQADLEAAMLEAYPASVRGDVRDISRTTSNSLVKSAILAVLIATVLMLVYIAFRFDLTSGISAVLGLIHDVLIMLSFMVIFRSVIQMNSSFIAAALTIVGYSINNTIVIFDRIRENAKKNPSMKKEEITNLSIRESLGRTILTTITTLITIVLLCILGVASIREFALPIIVGILAGMYSANMINGYIWAWLEERNFPHRRKVKKA